MRGKLFAGTSGWSYKEWGGSFYPKDLKKNGELSHYATVFNTVEINATFYRLASEKMVKGWYDRSPKDFVFAAKGSRFITHIKRLVVERVSLKKYFDRVKFLKEKCGPILWQLPPNFAFKDLDRLGKFLKMLPKRYQHAVEFRHPSWHEHKETFTLLRKHRVTHASVSSQRMPPNHEVTGNFVYIRFHGLKGGVRHDYTRDELRPWAEHCRRQIRRGKKVYAYFNNDQNTRAPLNAELFREMVAGKKSRTKKQRITTNKHE